MNANVAAELRRELWVRGTSLSAAALVHSHMILAVLTQDTTFHTWCREIMKSRWEQLQAVLSQARLPSGQQCLTSLSRDGSAIALLQCHRGGSDCAALLQQHGVLATGGSSFGADATTARISMGGTAAGFGHLMARLSSIRG